jgi:hypothetical protein
MNTYARCDDAYYLPVSRDRQSSNVFHRHRDGGLVNASSNRSRDKRRRGFFANI